MFVLEVEAETVRPPALRERVLAWPAEVGVDATGWLGTTGGVSADGRFLLLMRFASQEAAWIFSDLPSSRRWWESCRESLRTPPVFHESTEVAGILGGGSDAATAVVVTRGSGAPARVRTDARRLESVRAADRPGLIGGLVVWHDDARCTEVLYLSGAPGDLRRLAVSTPLGSLRTDVGATRAAIDLDDPWLISPDDGTRR